MRRSLAPACGRRENRVIRATAIDIIENTGPMTRKLMATADEEFLATIDDHPALEGVTVGGEDVDYRTIRSTEILERLGEKGLLERAGN